MKDPLVSRLVEEVEKFSLFTEFDSLLVGVSGGRDSVVLCDLLYRAGYAFSLAHCNFTLRGEESDGDAEFVKMLADRYEKPLHSRTFDTDAYAEENGISIEMAARDLRYQWFEETRKKHHYDWILVAHHRDDDAETFFLNLARGTGLAGLTGMKQVSGKVVRPLLFAASAEIGDYASRQHLQFREDSSNKLLIYQRNKIRHNIMPLLEELNPAFRDGIRDTMSHLADAYQVYLKYFETIRERVVRTLPDDMVEISLAEVSLLEPKKTVLFELLRPYGFNNDVVQDILRSMDGQSGKKFYSPAYRAVTNRESLLLQPIRKVKQGRIYIGEDCSELDSPLRMTLSIHPVVPGLKIDPSPRVAQLDYDKLQFPLILRKWEKGDYFFPLGLGKSKKLSDFFVDEKLSLPEKENTWILANGEEIVWIVGSRIDDRYKVRPETRRLLVVRLL